MSDRSERLFAVLAPLNALVLVLPLVLAGVELARDAARLLAATVPVDVAALERPVDASLAAHARVGGEDAEPVVEVGSAGSPTAGAGLVVGAEIPAADAAHWGGRTGYGL